MRDLATLEYPRPSTARWHAKAIGALLAACASACPAQDTARSGALFDALARMDKELFDAAFVDCDAGKFRAIFTEDAEFYHDRTGLAVGEAARTMKSCPRDDGVTRTLVPGSLEVYPMQGYGAIQIGRHVFARKGEPGSEVARFVHLWKQEDGGWRLARVLSFDHKPSPPSQQAALGVPRVTPGPMLGLDRYGNCVGGPVGTNARHRQEAPWRGRTCS